MARNHGLPGVVLPLRCLPPLCLLPGQTPAHEARCFAEGKHAISLPISATLAAAALWPTQGIVSKSATASVNGASAASIAPVRSRSWASRKSIWTSTGPALDQHRPQQDAVLRVHTPVERLPQQRQFGAQPATGQFSEHVRIGFTGADRLEQVPPACAYDVRGDRAHLQIGRLQEPVQAMDRLGPRVSAGSVESASARAARGPARVG
jgi:hypothetical protein